VSFSQIAQLGGKVVFPQAAYGDGARDIQAGMSFGGAGEFYPYAVRVRKGKGV